MNPDQEAAMKMEHPTFKEQHEAIRDGRMLGSQCTKCGHKTITPMMRCSCGGTEFQTREFANTGTVLTYTVQRVASEEFLNDVPYAWIIVQLDDEGPRATGWIPFVSKSGELKIGDKVKLTTSYKPGCMFEKA
jgi:uncharacterized OB-fold protein